MDPVIDAGAYWDERYAEDGYIYGTSPNEFLSEHVGRIPGERVLCLADGEGRNSVFLARRGFRVTSVDVSAVAIEKAGRLAKAEGVNVEFLCADLMDFEPGDGAWDGIVSIYAHMPSVVRRAIHGRIARSLRVGGVFVLEAYSPAQVGFGTGGPRDPDQLMSASVLPDELFGLRFERLEELERDVVEGPHHTGRAAVVQAIGVRAG